VALDLETRQVRELYSGGSLAGMMAVSPDGRQLAFLDSVSLGGTSEKLTLKVMPTAGGEPRTLLDRKDLNLRDTDRFDGPFAWTPDGRYVLFTIGGDPDLAVQEGLAELWQIPAEGGKPRKLLEMESPYRAGGLRRCPLSLHPDGRRIAFQKGKERQIDLWVMENLLSKFKAGK
jgi:Tol biopolymer transport system component